MKIKFLALNVIKKIQILLSFALLFSIFSCTDLASGYVYEKADNAKYLYIKLESGERILAIHSASRSITASSIDLSDSTIQSYNFYIWGKSSSGTVAPKKVFFTPSDSITGTIDIDFPVTTYSFTLAVTETEPDELTSSDILSKAIFVGYTQADLSYSKTVKFNLTTNGLKAPGRASLNFYLDSSTWTDGQVSDLLSNYKVTVGLFDTSGILRSGEWGLESLSKSTPISSGDWFSSILPGTYDIKVSMSEQIGEHLICSYTDKIIISPNREINADVYIPNILLELPAAPADFKAAHCMDYRCYRGTEFVDNGDGSYTSNSGIELSSNADLEKYDFNTYGILFSWMDNSNNESGFKITLADLSKITDGVKVPSEIIASVPAVITDSYWKETVEPFLGQQNVVSEFSPSSYMASANYIGGSLEKNSSAFVVFGTFGSCYIAKIEAMNAAGLSEACYVKLDEDFNVNVIDKRTDSSQQFTYVGKAFASAENPCKVINRYKVSYNLCGGKIVYTNGPNLVVNNSSSFVKYHTYGDGKIECYTAPNSFEGTIDNPALLYFGEDSSLRGNRWTRWQNAYYGGTDLIDIIGGTSVAVDAEYTYQKPNDYTGYTSLYLFARYY